MFLSAQERRFLLVSIGLVVAVIACWNAWNDTGSQSALLDWESLFWLCVFYPVCEELIFRGVIQHELNKLAWFKNKRFLLPDQNAISLSNGVTSLLFAASHAIRFTNPTAALVFFPSLIFGMAFDIRQKLWAPMLLHSFMNLAGLMAVPFYEDLS